MKKTSSTEARRIGVAEAKAEFSRTLREASVRPTIVHNRGRDVAVVVGIEEYERLVAADPSRDSPLRAFLDNVEALKRRYGAGAELEADRLTYTPRDPFGRRRR